MDNHSTRFGFFSDPESTALQSFNASVIVLVGSSITDRDIFATGSVPLVVHREMMMEESKEIYAKTLCTIIDHVNFGYRIAFVGNYGLICRVMADVIRVNFMDLGSLEELIKDIRDGR